MIDLFLSTTGRSVVRTTVAVVVVGATVGVGVVVRAVAMRRESQSVYITNLFDREKVNVRVRVVIAVRSIAIVTAAVVVALGREVRYRDW